MVNRFTAVCVDLAKSCAHAGSLTIIICTDLVHILQGQRKQKLRFTELLGLKHTEGILTLLWF